MIITDRIDGRTGWSGRLAVISLVLLAVTMAWAGDGQRRGDTGSRRVEPINTRAALRALDDCGQMREYLADVMLETLLYYRYSPMDLFSLGGAETDAPTDYTTTNNQEAGVDEIDVVKTDGSYIYMTRDSGLEIVKAWPAHETELIATVQVGEWAQGLFLEENKALVFSDFRTYDEDFFPDRSRAGTRIDLIDLTDRSAPTILRTIELEGSLVGARKIDGQVYAVVWTPLPMPEEAWDLIHNDDLGLPELAWDASDEERDAAFAEARVILQPLVEALVADLDSREVLPLVRDYSPATPSAQVVPLMECGDLYRPTQKKSYSVLSVLHLDLTGPRPEQNLLSATGLFADAWTVYANKNNLYLAEGRNWWWWWDVDSNTAIHKFELGSEQGPVHYAATGLVPGWLLNQFSMSEHEGYLRVATTQTDWWWGTSEEPDPGSLVTVLADDLRGELVTTGEVTGIAPGERIYAVRFMGTIGYVVTFEQIDPLFTLDLAEPTNPRVVGELELPGFSSYLHPAGEGNLLAVGMSGELDGTITGLAVSLFDVSDLANPALAHQYTVSGEGSFSAWSEALSDHHAFTYHRNILSIPATIYNDFSPGFSGLIVLWVDPELGIHELGRIDHDSLPNCPNRACWTRLRRSLYIEDYLYSLSTKGIKVNWLYDPTITIAEVPFYSGSPLP